MISYVAKVIYVFASTIQNVLLIASHIGELIIYAGLWTYNVLLHITDNLLSFFVIVYEDNICMFTELPNSANNIIDSMLNQFLHVHNRFEEVSRCIFDKINTLITSFAWLIYTVFMIISEVCSLLTNTVIFVGETTWFMITFIPIYLPQIMKSGTKFTANILVNTIVDAYMRLLRFTNYLTEVPLESFFGITSAIIIIRLCVYFKETILTNINNLYWSVVRKFLYMYYVCYNYWINPEVQIITRMVSGDIMSTRQVQLENVVPDDANTAADALCVICQERQKCVLILPCRHICLCTECCRRLYSYQRTCPICRTFIYHSVTVYW